MKNKRFLTILLATVLLTACGEKIHDLEYYKTHEKERIARIKKCNSNPGKYKEDGNCINAHKAELILCGYEKTKKCVWSEKLD